jgi:hypothetical protein
MRRLKNILKLFCLATSKRESIPLVKNEAYNRQEVPRNDLANKSRYIE